MRHGRWTPNVRPDGLLVERLPGETLVYDERRDEAHCLSGLAAEVFDLCDGTRAPTEIAALTSSADAEGVSEILSELHDKALLAAPGLSRRQVIRRGALTGTAAVALITTIVAPTPVAAQSPGGGDQPVGGSCAADSDCASGSCENGVCCQVVNGACTSSAECCDNVECSSGGTGSGVMTCRVQPGSAGRAR